MSILNVNYGSQSAHTLFNDSPIPENGKASKVLQGERGEERKGGQYWRWDASKSMMVLDSELEDNASIILKTSAEPQITLDSPSISVTDCSEPSFLLDCDSSLPMPPTPILPSTPAFKSSSFSSSYSLSLSTPEDTNFLLENGLFSSYPYGSSSSIYHSTTSSFSQPPLTPTGIGLGFTGLTKSDGSTPFDGRGIVSIHSDSPWRTSSPRPAKHISYHRHPNPPSQVFLNEIYHTFTFQEEENDSAVVEQRKKVTLLRNLSAPTASSALKRTSRMQRSNTVPIWRRLAPFSSFHYHLIHREPQIMDLQSTASTSEPNDPPLRRGSRTRKPRDRYTPAPQVKKRPSSGDESSEEDTSPRKKPRASSAPVEDKKLDLIGRIQSGIPNDVIREIVISILEGKTEKTTAFSDVSYTRLLVFIGSSPNYYGLPLRRPKDLKDLGAKLGKAEYKKCYLPPTGVIIDIVKRIDATLVATGYNSNEDNEATKTLLFNAIMIPIIALFQGAVTMKPETQVVESQVHLMLLAGFADQKIYTFGNLTIVLVELKRALKRIVGLCQLFCEMLAVFRDSGGRNTVYGVLADISSVYVYALEPTRPEPCFLIVEEIQLGFGNLEDVKIMESVIHFVNLMFSLILSGVKTALKQVIQTSKQQKKNDPVNSSSFIASRRAISPPPKDDAHGQGGMTESDSRESVKEWEKAYADYNSIEEALLVLPKEESEVTFDTLGLVGNTPLNDMAEMYVFSIFALNQSILPLFSSMHNLSAKGLAEKPPSFYHASMGLSTKILQTIRIASQNVAREMLEKQKSMFATQDRGHPDLILPHNIDDRYTMEEWVKKFQLDSEIQRSLQQWSRRLSRALKHVSELRRAVSACVNGGLKLENPFFIPGTCFNDVEVGVLGEVDGDDANLREFFWANGVMKLRALEWLSNDDFTLPVIGGIKWTPALADRLREVVKDYLLPVLAVPSNAS
uniref:Uncharacterized protein n=1 Tax=Moniliophthora roreri TaxID=221103 RepID=A0A0W0EY79_MONRR